MRPGLAINADARSHAEGMPLDPGLELLGAAVGEPHRPARKEHRGERQIEWKGRVVAAAEAAAQIGEMRVDTRGLQILARVTEA